MSEDLINKIISGELKLYQVEEHTSTRKEAVDLRRAAISKMTGTDLTHIGDYTYDAEVVTKKNIENAIGAVQVPLGVAGPLTHQRRVCARASFTCPWRRPRARLSRASTAAAPSARTPEA